MGIQSRDLHSWALTWSTLTWPFRLERSDPIDERQDTPPNCRDMLSDRRDMPSAALVLRHPRLLNNAISERRCMPSASVELHHYSVELRHHQTSYYVIAGLRITSSPRVELRHCWALNHAIAELRHRRALNHAIEGWKTPSQCVGLRHGSNTRCTLHQQ